MFWRLMHNDSHGSMQCIDQIAFPISSFVISLRGQTPEPPTNDNNEEIGLYTSSLQSVRRWSSTYDVIIIYVKSDCLRAS